MDEYDAKSLSFHTKQGKEHKKEVLGRI